MYRAYRHPRRRIRVRLNPNGTNTPLMRRILELRHEEAKMLGYANFAEVSLAPKMADTPTRC